MALPLILTRVSVFVNDRTNNRVQVFDSDGNYLSASGASVPSRPTSTTSWLPPTGYLWAADRGTNKMLKYDLDGNFLYAWGTWGRFPGRHVGRARHQCR